MGRTVGHYQFGAWDLPTKYGWMHSGPGVSEGTMMQDLAKRMAERMISSGDLVAGLLGGAEWAGAAATAAGQAMQRGAEQINQTAVGAATAERCVTELGESFSSAQHRVPSPNEIPSGLGDKFAFGAAAGFNAVSPFDVQSPIHAAMEQRRALDEQANQALTDHMTTSRDRLDTIPPVTAPPPMTVSTEGASASGVGSVVSGYPAGGAAANGGGGAPFSTAAASWSGSPVAAAPSAGPGPAPVPPGTPSPVGTPPAGVGPAYRPHPSGPGQFGPTAARPGQVPFVPGAGGAASRGPGFGARPGAGGAGVPGRGASGLGGAPVSGGSPVPGGAPVSGGPGDSARGGGRGGGGGRGAGANSFLHPPIGGGRGQGGEDTEHKDRYAQQTDHIIGELPLVAPAVIGETPEEEDLRLRRAREGS